MNLLQQFSEVKNLLLDKYELLIKGGFVPLENSNIDINTIEKQKIKLDEERFYITVCGQIKCGKSTLLNAIIFRDEVLPVYDVPWTAKLTEIKFGEKPSYKVIFYSKDEWEEIKNSEYAENLNKAVKESASKGVYPKNIINSEPLIKKVDGIEGLTEYISADGKYTPFVNKVEIEYPSSLIKDVIVVDTPGTNDPNRFREEQTKNWIKMSDAAIYVLYTKQPLHREDLDFIDKYFMTIPDEKILICVNKADQTDNIDEIIQYVERELKKQLGERKILEGKNFLPISARAALISVMDEDKKEMSKDLLEAKNRDSYWIEKKGNIDDFINEISKHLIYKKGLSIIESHIKFIEGIIDGKTNFLTQKIKEKEEQLNITLLEAKERQKRKNELVKEHNEIIKTQNKFKKKIDSYFIDLKDTFRDIIHHSENEIRNRIYSYIEHNKIDSLIKNLGWQLKYQVTDLIINIRNKIKQRINNFQNEIEELLNEIKRKYSMVFDEELVDIWFSPIDFYNIEEEISEYISNEVNKTALESLKVNIKILWFIPTPFTNKKETKKNFRSLISDVLKDVEKYFFEKCLDSVKTETYNITDKTFTQITNYIKEVMNMLDKIEKDIITREEKKKMIKEEIYELTNSRNNFENISSKIRTELEEIKINLREAKNKKDS